jgi:hypothetical protein
MHISYSKAECPFLSLLSLFYFVVLATLSLLTSAFWFTLEPTHTSTAWPFNPVTKFTDPAKIDLWHAWLFNLVTNLLILLKLTR